VSTAPGRHRGGAPDLPGPLLFARYAYPPNALGFCGPPDSAALRGHGRAGVVTGELLRLARSFAGAWPYLESIAAHAGIGDPLDRRVVEAYWVGNRLLDGTTAAGARDGLGSHLAPGLTGELAAAGLAHHSFHVLCAYPWAGMLDDPGRAGQAVAVLDQCRIRWGRVRALRGDRVAVRCQPLTWDGRRLSLGAPVATTARAPAISTAALAVGDWVSLHWDWVCDRLTDRQVRALRATTRRHLRLVNRCRTELSTRRGVEPPATG
jgi:Family of unknown function (DUF6390)